MAADQWTELIVSERRTWLVTGAAGFVGSHLVCQLLRLDQDVVGLDNYATGHRSNLDLVRADVGESAWGRFRIVEGDIREPDTCTAATHGADIVLHQAALGSVPRSMVRPLDTHAVNVDGTMNVFLAALDADVDKVVYASSSSVYGDDPELPKVESRTGRPLSPYAASKQIGELYAETLSRTHGLPAVGLRYFNVVGTRQDPEGPYAAVVPRWLTALRSGTQPIIYGDGETSRDFCPVANVVQANLLAAISADHTNGKAYNVALGGTTTLYELLVAMRTALSRTGVECESIEPAYEDFRPGDIRHSLADISLARDELGYAPQVSLAEGLDETVAG